MTGKQLVQGCNAVAWVGVEPTTFELQCGTLSTEPRCSDDDYDVGKTQVMLLSLTPMVMIMVHPPTENINNLDFPNAITIFDVDFKLFNSIKGKCEF